MRLRAATLVEIGPGLGLHGMNLLGWVVRVGCRVAQDVPAGWLDAAFRLNRANLRFGWVGLQVALGRSVVGGRPGSAYSGWTGRLPVDRVGLVVSAGRLFGSPGRTPAARSNFGLARDGFGDWFPGLGRAMPGCAAMGRGAATMAGRPLLTL